MKKAVNSERPTNKGKNEIKESKYFLASAKDKRFKHGDKVSTQVEAFRRL